MFSFYGSVLFFCCFLFCFGLFFLFRLKGLSHIVQVVFSQTCHVAEFVLGFLILLPLSQKCCHLRYYHQASLAWFCSQAIDSYYWTRLKIFLVFLVPLPNISVSLRYEECCPRWPLIFFFFLCFSFCHMVSLLWPWLTWNSLWRPGLSWTDRGSPACLLSAGTKGLCYHYKWLTLNFWSLLMGL